MKTIIGNDTYVFIIDELNKINEPIYVGIGQSLISNNDDVNGIDPIQTNNESEVFIALNQYELNLENLPLVGEWVNEGKFYDVNGVALLCRQDHTRTEHDPITIPALFSFYRENSVDLEWIINESVELGWIRVYEGNSYEVIQAHMTLDTWKPDTTPTLWSVISDEILEWVQPTGAHDAYNTGDKVYFPTINDNIYESLIDANVWSPTVYPAGWLQL